MKVGEANVNVCILRRLKEKLAWAIDKQLRVVSNKMLFKTVTVFIRIKVSLIYMQGLKCTPGSAAE